MAPPLMFSTHDGFCSNCGTLLPSVHTTTSVTCYNCQKTFHVNGKVNVLDSSHLDSDVISYTIPINRPYVPGTRKQVNEEHSNEAVGPIAERFCQNCGHNKMSYKTMQLRSADEGQTVFYTCVKCGNKESENA